MSKATAPVTKEPEVTKTEVANEQVNTANASATAPVTKEPESVANISPNSKLDVGSIDYKNLKGAEFEKYVSIVGDRTFIKIEDGKAVPIVGQLKENDSYDFELYKAKPILKPRYVGVPNSPQDLVGLELVSIKPELTTRIQVKIALLHNAQILNAHSRAGHGKYYLLKK